MNNDYLMRRIRYSPDYVRVYCDIPIRFLQEVYFNSIISLPKAIFDEAPFSNTRIFEDYIEVPLDQWSHFQDKFVAIFNNENNELLIARIFNILDDFNLATEENLHKEVLCGTDVKTLLDLMALADAFAIFNMFIPLSKFRTILCNEGAGIPIEDILICAFEPHRILLRKHKLKLALCMKLGKEIESQVDYYFKNLVFYEEFEKWLFSTEKYDSKVYLFRELKNLNKKYTYEELQNELITIEEKRNGALKRALHFSCRVRSIDRYLILPAIVTEEERRHMIECKLLLLLGKVFKDIEIDIARSSIEELVNACNRGVR